MSYSFSPALLFQWNLFPSAFLIGGKTVFPPTVVETERRAVLSRMPAPVVQFEVGPTNLNVTSIWSFCSDGLFVGVSVRPQKLSPISVKGSSRATTLERPGVLPPIVGSEESSKKLVSERKGYQPFVILALDRHAVRAASIPREIVLIALT